MGSGEESVDTEDAEDAEDIEDIDDDERESDDESDIIDADRFMFETWRGGVSGWTRRTGALTDAIL